MPVILQISMNAVKLHCGRLHPIAAAARAASQAARVDVSLHLDHVQDLASTRASAEWAHDHGLCLEAELGKMGGEDGAHAPGVRTDPQEARDFVAATGVDALADVVARLAALVAGRNPA